MRAERIATDRTALAWVMIAGGGLIVATAAVMAVPESRILASPGARLVPHLPRVVGLAVVALLGLASLLIVGLLWPREVRRRRRRGAEEFELYYEPPRISPWLLAVLLLLVVLLVVAVVSAVWLGVPFLEGARRVLAPPTAPIDGIPAAPELSDKPGTSIKAYDIALAVLGIVVGAVIVGLLVWFHVGDRVMRWWVGRIFEGDRPSLEAATMESLDELRRQPDARSAIIHCYQRFEQALAAARTPRAPWQTPTEFMRAVLERLALPREAVRLLTRLFELSRFSQRDLGASERDVACDCLEQIKTALERHHPDATSA